MLVLIMWKTALKESLGEMVERIMDFLKVFRNSSLGEMLMRELLLVSEKIPITDTS